VAAQRAADMGLAEQPRPSARPSAGDWRSAIPVSWVRQEGGWTLYSRFLNFVSCAAEDPATGDTWLGTPLGIKRVTPDGTLRRIYTGADGLPGHCLRALAVGPTEAWCVVAPDHRQGRFALCRMDRMTDRWETLREVTPPPANVIISPERQFPDFLAAGPSRFLACVFGHVARRENGSAFCVLDREQGTWRDIPWEPERRIPNPRNLGFDRDRFPEPRWLHLDDESVFVGTAQGLGRYDLAAGAWDWLLGDHVIAGGAADGETLWVAAWKNGAVRGTFADLLRLDAVTGQTVGRFPSPLAETLPLPQQARVVLIPERGDLWLVEQKTAFYRGPEPAASLLIRFERATDEWQSWAADAAAGDLPLSVRLAAALACAGPPPPALREQLPGWFSPPAELPVMPEDVRRPPPARLVDAAGAAVWAVADRTVLVRHSQNGGPEQRHPLPDFLLPSTPPVFSVAVLADVLYASTTDGLWRRGLPDGDWALIPLPPVEPSRRHAPERLLAAGDSLWVGTMAAIWRYDPALGEFHEKDADPFGQSAMRLRLLDHDAGSVWLVDKMYGQYLYWIGPDEEQPQRAPIAVRPGGNIAGVCGGYVWYSGESVRERPGHTEVVGCDLKSGEWTLPLYLEGRCSQVSLRAAEGSIYVGAGMHSGDSNGSINRYDTLNGRWENMAPTPPPLPGVSRSGRDTPLRLVSVGADAFWLVNPRATALVRWDRKRQAWQEHSTGTSTPSSYPEQDGSVVRHGASFFVASALGLWRFDVQGETWARLPFPAPAGRRLEVVPRAVDDRAVWALCYDAEARQAYGARFDKRERAWRLWDQSDGFPVDQGPTQLATDGSSAVVMTYGGGFFPLDTAADRWEEHTASLSRAWAGQGGALVYQPDLVGDPPYVWVRGEAQWDDDHKDEGLPPPRDPLAMRWDASGGFVRMEPPEWSPSTDANIRLLGSDLLADGEAVWVMNVQGLWRWDKAAQTWHLLALPRSFPDRFVLTVGHMERSADGAVWLVGRDILLRWAAPKSPEV